MLVKNPRFGKKIKILVKDQLFVKILKCWLKINYLLKIKMLVKNQRFAKKLKFLSKIKVLLKKFGQESKS